MIKNLLTRRLSLCRRSVACCRICCQIGKASRSVGDHGAMTVVGDLLAASPVAPRFTLMPIRNSLPQLAGRGGICGALAGLRPR
jgi:hypothetical protein